MENSKTKILHVVTKGSPFGGAQKYVCDLVTSLSRDQFESVVVCGVGDELKNAIELRSTNYEVRIIQIPEMGRDINLIAEWKVFWKLVKIIRDEKPNIVHTNSSKAAGLSTLASFLIRTSYFVFRNSSPAPQVIFTAHGWPFNEKRNIISRCIIWLLSYLTVILSHKVIVIAQSEYTQALTMPFTNHKITLIYNGILPINFVDKDTARMFLTQKITSQNLAPETIWIGTIAELHPNKNLAAMIEAFSRTIQDSRFEHQTSPIYIIIGEGEQRKKLEQKIQEYNLAGSVFLIGKIPQAYLYLKAFDIFVLPSIKEGLPYTLLEAGLAGLPCLSTTVGGIPEIIENSVSGILVTPTAQSLHDGLQSLLSNTNQAQKLGNKLKEKVTQHFSSEKMVRETIDVYKQ